MENVTATMIEKGETRTGHFSALEITMVVPTPIVTPMAPPIGLITMDFGCANRDTDTDLEGAFGDGDEHDVHAADAADDERNAGDGGKEHCEHRRGLSASCAISARSRTMKS